METYTLISSLLSPASVREREQNKETVSKRAKEKKKKRDRSIMGKEGTGACLSRLYKSLEDK